MLRVDPAKTRVVNGRGRSISTAILYDVVSELRTLSPGETVTLRTDPLAAVDSDVRAWCRTSGHELVEVSETDDVLEYAIRKAAGRREQPGWALVISEPGLEELLSPLGFALAAALGGSSVAIYFQGPAVRVLKRSFSERLHG